MKYAYYYKENLKLAIPVIVSQVGSMSVQLVDTVMVGHLGASELASIAFANTLAWPVMLFGQATTMGLTPLVGRASSLNNRDRIVALLQNSLLVNMLMSLAVMLVIIGLRMCMDYMGQDVSILPIAKSYIIYQILSVIPQLLFFTCKQFLEGLGNTVYAMVITISGNVLNVLLNFCLIYGLWIFPEMGAVGAGAATFISRVVMVSAFVGLMMTKTQYLSYIKSFAKDLFSVFRIRRLLNVGIPIAVQTGTEMAALSLMAIVIGMFGANELAGHQIAINIPSMSFMVISGLAAATTIRVSQDFGLRLYEQMKSSMIASVHMIFVFTVVTSLLIALFARPLASLFTTSPEAINAAVGFLMLGAIFQIPDGLQGVILGALRGVLEVKKPMINALLSYFVIAFPLGYVLCFHTPMGADGAWVAFIVALSVLAVLYYRSFRKVYKSLIKSSLNVK